jgi:glycosyltransferase involved in cell wall biosynthesis
MRIGHVSTFWPKPCAFPAYTASLISGMRRHRADSHVVIAERPADAAETDEWRCVPTFHRREDYVDAIVARARAERLDLVEIQYANDVLGDDERFPRLLEALADRGIATVVNAHSVYPPRWRTGYRPDRDARSFDVAVGARASSVLVHTRRMRGMLLERGLAPEKVVVVPHGTRLVTLPAQEESRARLGLAADARVVLFFGFIWSGKGISFLLSAFARVARRMPRALLYIGGYTRKKSFTREVYMTYLETRMRLHGIRDRTVLYGGYVPDELVPHVYSAADVVALPYRQAYASVSAVVHQAAGMGKIPLCSRTLKFEEVGERVSPELLADMNDAEAWAEALARLLGDEPYAAELRARVARFADETRWERVGAVRLALYDALLAGRAPASIGEVTLDAA